MTVVWNRDYDHIVRDRIGPPDDCDVTLVFRVEIERSVLGATP
jgi:hypothetical protein